MVIIYMCHHSVECKQSCMALATPLLVSKVPDYESSVYCPFKISLLGLPKDCG